ncbi:hypothetical protein NO932_06640 [Pelagibacterium sp. 26DY04]|uniref:hypothetical protein n=1 Tax=Pelagibacterium sp. 26DY04 TaxID=2967130 RepID=UPI002814CB6B|nr:hypothetical protein [Pelagibacterium sp. 26DY04]WMT88283.1 hypothetical protein NO932_06640 [Pelagibacterium sp. 26DY04]
MYQASFTATDSADWAEAIEVINGDTNLPLDISDIAFELAVRDRCGAELLNASTEAGTLERAGTNVIRWRFTPTDMGGLCTGTTYKVGLTMTTDEGTTQVLVGSLSFIDGVVE